MLGSLSLPSLEDLKTQAKRLRTELGVGGTPVSYARALELLAHQYGHRDWNTLHAAVGNRPPVCPFAIGQRVHGEYLGQPFEGEVVAVSILGGNERFRITVVFDAPVDVVTFESFSAFRRRVSATVNRRGVTAEKTSDGQPHLTLAL